MDCRMSDVIVILDKRWEERLEDAVRQLTEAGMEIRLTDDDRSVVEGCIDTCKLHDLEKMDCVDYVRNVLTYEAEFPPGHPRDTNGV